MISVKLFNNRFRGTSLWNRDDCVRVLMCNRDRGVRDFSQQVHQFTYAIIDHPPVS